MAVKTFYMLNTKVPGGNYLSMQDGGSAPVTATGTSSWAAGTGATPLPRYARMIALGAVGTAGWTGTGPITTAPNSTNGDAFRSGPYTGTFANTNWTLAIEVIASASSAGSGNVEFEIYRSVNADGSGATRINSATQTTTGYAALSTTAQALSVTWAPGGTITLNNEYLFFTVEVKATAASSNNTRTLSPRVGSANAITTSNFISQSTSTLTGGYIPTGAITKKAIGTDIGSITDTGVLVAIKKATKASTSSLTNVGNLATEYIAGVIHKSLTASTSFTGVLSRVVDRLKTLTASTTFAGTLIRSRLRLRTNSGSISVSGRLTRKMVKKLTANISNTVHYLINGEEPVDVEPPIVIYGGFTGPGMPEILEFRFEGEVTFFSKVVTRNGGQFGITRSMRAHFDAGAHTISKPVLIFDGERLPGTKYKNALQEDKLFLSTDVY